MANNHELIKSELTQKQYEKMKKQTVWVACMSITIFFTAFVSAYVVQSSQEVWYSINFPQSFTYSTIAIILSSVALVGALFAARKDNQPMIKLMVGLTLALGVAFSFFQYRGWNEMIASNNLVSGGFINDLGMYGKDYYFELNGDVVDFNGKNYEVGGQELAQDEVDQFRVVGNQLTQGELMNHKGDLSHNVAEVAIFRTKDSSMVDLSDKGKSLGFSDRSTLFNFALSVERGMEYFKNNMEYGKDYRVRMNGEDLEFENKEFFYKELKLTEDELVNIETDVFVDAVEFKLKEGKVYNKKGELSPLKKSDFATGIFKAGKTSFPIKFQDGNWIRERTKVHEDDMPKIVGEGTQSNSYRYVVTFLHVLHVLGGLIYLIILFINALNNKFTSSNHLKIKTGGIYWHFLGGIWIFLYLFFQYYD